MATLLRNERGATLIEFAVGGMLFFVLLFGIAEFGRAIWLYGTVSHGAREGVRYAMVRGTESGKALNATSVQAYVRSIAPGLADATVTTTWPTNQSPGQPVRVRVDLTFDPVVPFVPALPMTTTSQMVISW